MVTRETSSLLNGEICLAETSFFMGITLSATKRIENRAKEITGVISLAQGTPSFASHPLIQNAVIEAIRNNLVDKYSPVQGLPELRVRISEKLQKEAMPYDPYSEILITAGGLESLSAIMLSFIKSGDEVIILSPAFPNYERITRMAKGKPVFVPLQETNGWKLDVPLLQSKITNRTKAIIVCNPNNPTGSRLTKQELLEIGMLAVKHNLLVLSDDIYKNFYYGTESLFNLCMQKEFKKHVIRIVSFSKDFALSGWRIGFIQAHRQIITQILPIHDNLINCAPVVSQYAAMAALKNEELILGEYHKIYANRRKIMGTYLEKLSGLMEFVWPQGSYYFFPKITKKINTELLCFDILEKMKVATVPGDDFGPGGYAHIRLCFGKSEEEIEEGMKRITRYFTNELNAKHSVANYQNSINQEQKIL